MSKHIDITFTTTSSAGLSRLHHVAVAQYCLIPFYYVNKALASLRSELVRHIEIPLYAGSRHDINVSGTVGSYKIRNGYVCCVKLSSLRQLTYEHRRNVLHSGCVWLIGVPSEMIISFHFCHVLAESAHLSLWLLYSISFFNTVHLLLVLFK